MTKLQENFDLFEISNWKKHREINDTTTGKVPGKLEKETPSTNDVEKICALKAKAYCFKLFVENWKIKSKTSNVSSFVNF